MLPDRWPIKQMSSCSSSSTSSSSSGSSSWLVFNRPNTFLNKRGILYAILRLICAVNQAKLYSLKSDSYNRCHVLVILVMNCINLLPVIRPVRFPGL